MASDSLHIFIEGVEHVVPAGCTVGDIIRRFSPFGDEAVICSVDETVYKSIGDVSQTLHDHAQIRFFPLVIGG